jgi:hypothetical protein
MGGGRTGLEQDGRQFGVNEEDGEDDEGLDEEEDDEEEEDEDEVRSSFLELEAWLMYRHLRLPIILRFSPFPSTLTLSILGRRRRLFLL